jgi:D-alanyl-D-alanine carboxypeptidase
VTLVVLAGALVFGIVQMSMGGDATPTNVAGTGAPPESSPRGTSNPLPSCIYGDDPAEHVGYDDWDRTILDTRYRLPTKYRPPDLVPVSDAGFDSDREIRQLVVVDLAALRIAAAEAGHPVEVVAAFRSFADQRALFEERKEQFGYDRSLDKTARAGHSEHQLGTAVDFKSAGQADVTQAWGNEPTGRWMAENAYRFGFVLSYPKDRRSVTCYPYEPWHFRYVGRELAARVVASGLTLRQYLWERWAS